MKVLNLALDKKILEKDSAVVKRAIAYGNMLEEYFIVVPGKNQELKLSDKTTAIGLSANNKFATLLKIFQYLDKHLQRYKYHLITIQDVYYLASIGINLASKFGIKTEVQVHGFEKMSFFRQIIAKSNLKKADKIRTVSQRLKNQIIKNFGIDESKIYISPVAINKQKILSQKAVSDLKEKDQSFFTFLTVGRLVPVKNIALQIKALSRITNKNSKLIIVGDGPEKENLKKLAKDLKVLDKIIFTGWVDDVHNYYKRADCLLLSSDSEGYGMVVAEAVLSDLPVIMTDVGIAGELVQDNINGFIVPVSDEKALANAMDKISSGNDLQKKFRLANYQFKNKILDINELQSHIVYNWKKTINV